jgi:glutamyl-Q tRNA(Asp) synthetase
MYIGRFAPSPTGALHFGSLVAALASWLDARAAGGRWLVRIEDLDTPRVQPAAADEILGTLHGLGLRWDGPVLRQSSRTARYAAALEQLSAHTYACGCTRKEIADSALGLAADGAQIYPGSCRGGLPAGEAARAVRVKTPERTIAFHDRVQGAQQQSLQDEVGDFVLYRADGLFAYQLAVVVDDAEQGITDVVRGADLLGSTARQIHLQRLLTCPTPRYLHVPVAVNERGEKLSKQSGAASLDVARGREALASALAFLGQQPSASLEEAARRWDAARVPCVRTLLAPSAAAGAAR